MTENPQTSEDTDAPDNRADPPALLRLVGERLSASSLSGPAKTLLLQALGESTDTDAAFVGGADRVYLNSVAVSGFRGIGRPARLQLTPGPGVTLVVGRNGSGKSSFAEAIETAFTGRSSRWDGRNAVWRGEWRNLHDGTQPKIERPVVRRRGPRAEPVDLLLAG